MSEQARLPGRRAARNINGRLAWSGCESKDCQRGATSSLRRRQGAGVGEFGSVGVLTATARPDQIVGIVLAIEEVGEDGGIETRVVELDREIIPPLAGAPRLRGTNFSSANQHAVGGRGLVGRWASGDDADALGLHREGDDVVLKLSLGHLSTVLFAGNYRAIDVFR